MNQTSQVAAETIAIQGVISKNVRKLRRALDLSQEALGDRVGMERCEVNKCERGKQLWKAPSLLRIARELHTTVEALASLNCPEYRSGYNPRIEPPRILADTFMEHTERAARLRSYGNIPPAKFMPASMHAKELRSTFGGVCHTKQGAAMVDAYSAVGDAWRSDYVAKGDENVPETLLMLAANFSRAVFRDGDPFAECTVDEIIVFLDFLRKCVEEFRFKLVLINQEKLQARKALCFDLTATDSLVQIGKTIRIKIGLEYEVAWSEQKEQVQYTSRTLNDLEELAEFEPSPAVILKQLAWYQGEVERKSKLPTARRPR